MAPARLPIPLKKLRRATAEDLTLGKSEAGWFFGDVDPKIVEEIARHGTVYRAMPNIVLRSEDADGDPDEPVSLLFIQEGFVHVEFEERERNVVIGSLGPGDIAGELELILGAPSNVSLVTAGCVTYVDIDPPKLLLELADREIFMSICRSLAGKLKARARRAGHRRTKGVASVVREYLYTVAREQGIRPGTKQIDCRTSLYMLASQIGISRQSVTNALHEIREFTYKDGAIAVRDRALLSELGSSQPKSRKQSAL